MTVFNGFCFSLQISGLNGLTQGEKTSEVSIFNTLTHICLMESGINDKLGYQALLLKARK